MERTLSLSWTSLGKCNRIEKNNLQPFMKRVYNPGLFTFALALGEKLIKGRTDLLYQMCIWLQKICKGSSWPTVKPKERTSDSSPDKYATRLLEKEFRTRLTVTDRLRSGGNLAEDQLVAKSSSTVDSLVRILVKCTHISFYKFEGPPWSWIHLQFSLPIDKVSSN